MTEASSGSIEPQSQDNHSRTVIAGIKKVLKSLSPRHGGREQSSSSSVNIRSLTARLILDELEGSYSYSPLDSFKTASQLKRGDFVGVEPLEAFSERASGTIEEFAVTRINHRKDRINNAAVIVDRFTTLYGDDVREPQKVLQQGTYSRTQKRAIKGAGRGVRRAEKIIKKHTAALRSSAKSEDLSTSSNREGGT